VIDRLEKADFVERRADPGDRRRWRLYLKPKSHAVLEEMDVIADGLRDDALRGVKRADIDTVMRVLAQLKQNLSAVDGVADEDTTNQTRGKS
jgi:MarR family transcriptional regulator for hemolysin